MQKLFLYALRHADNLNDDELAQKIKQFESGKDGLPKLLKLYAPVYLNVLRRVQEDRKNNPKVEMRRRKMLWP